MYFYELHEGDDDLFSDVLLARDEEIEPEDFFDLVQSIRRRVLDNFAEDTLIEAIAVELERNYGFVYVVDELKRVKGVGGGPAGVAGGAGGAYRRRAVPLGAYTSAERNAAAASAARPSVLRPSGTVPPPWAGRGATEQLALRAVGGGGVDRSGAGKD